MSRELARTFEVSASLEGAWMAMTDPEELNKWSFPMRRDDGSTRTACIHASLILGI